jgi:23S rRNA (guanosine2251-2'-O)-methyltransferase
LAGLLDTAKARGVDIATVDRVVGVTEAPQGIRAVAEPLHTYDLYEFVEPAPAALVVLDHLQDPHNVGAIARSALAAGMTGIVVSDKRAAPLQATAFKSAAGALERLRVCVHSSIADAVVRLQRAGVWVVGLSADAETPVFGLSLFTEPVAVVVGAEGSGLSRLVRDRSDMTVRIPMASSVESLNASAAATLAMFEVGRVRS